MGFREPTLGFDIPQASEVRYSPGSKIQGVSSKKGLGYSSHLEGRGDREQLLPRCSGTQIGEWKRFRVEEAPGMRTLEKISGTHNLQ